MGPLTVWGKTRRNSVSNEITMDYSLIFVEKQFPIMYIKDEIVK
jgi:hypothetical protein